MKPVEVSRRSAFASLPAAALAAMLLFLAAPGANGQAPPGPMPGATPSDKPIPKPPETAKGGKFAGTWQLNRNQSDDPRKQLQQASGNRDPWGRPRPRYGGPYGGHAGHDVSAMDDYSLLTIEQSASAIKVNSKSGRTIAHYSSERPASSDSSASSTHRSTNSSWENGQLVVVSDGEHGGKTTRTFSLSPDGRQLTLTTRIESPRFRHPVNIRFVYDPAASSGGS